MSRSKLAPCLAVLLCSCVDAQVDPSGTAGRGDAGSEAPGSGTGGATGGASGGALASSGGATPAGPGGGDPSRAPTTGASWIYLQGRQLFVGRRMAQGDFEMPTPYRLKCVGWSPTAIGQRNTSGYTLLYTEHAAQDVPLIAGVAANTVKTYSPLEANDGGLAVLDQLYARGVMVVMNVMPSKWEAESGAYLRTVAHFKSHPAILMWQLGNELNYNKLYGAASLDQAVALVARAVDEIHGADPEHPVSVSWGNAPTGNELARLANVDVWSLNLYPHLAMEPRLEAWKRDSSKPMFVGEYGADAYNTELASEDQPSQADATIQLTRQIHAHSSATDPQAAALGGCVFNLTDEWWKAMGSDTAHDAGGFDNSGVYPDGVANEEWWGLMTVQRQPRQAYNSLQTLFASL